VEGIDISMNEITSFLSGIHVYQIDSLGYAMSSDSVFTIGHITINDNDVDSNDEGIFVIFGSIGSDSTNDAMIIIGSIEISGNTVDSNDGIILGMNIGTPRDNTRVMIGTTTVADNLVWTTDKNSIKLDYLISLSNQVRVSMDEIIIEWNDIQGSDGTGIDVAQKLNLGDASSVDLDDIVLFANNIESSSIGLGLNGTKSVEVYGNNFIDNDQDADIYDTTIKWISPGPMWYKHGMRNYTSYIGNYWDSYTGSDQNDDGIGDTPYNTDHGMDTHPLFTEVENHLPPWDDTVPPEVVILSPSNGTAFKTGTILINWTGTDDLLGIDHFEIKLEGGNWTDVGMDRSHWFNDLTEGYHIIRVKAIDEAGNEGEDAIEIIVDKTAPQVSITAPIDDDELNTSVVMVEWIGMDDLSGIDHFSVKMDNGSWIDTGELMGYQFSDLLETDHYVEVMAFDIAGNSRMDRIDFLVDTTFPSLTMVYPTYGLYLTSNSVNAQWVTEDLGSGIDDNWVRLDDEEWLSPDMMSEHLYRNLTKGDHEISVKVRDNAGNWWVETVEFEVGDPVQVVNIISPTEGSYISNSTVEVKWRAFGTTYIPEVFQIRLDSGDWENLSLDMSKVLTGVTDGQHTVEVIMRDRGGNIEKDSVSFTVDTRAPTIVSFSHQGENSPPGDPIIIVFSERIAPGSISLKLNDLPYPGNFDDEGMILTIETSLFPGKQYVMDIVVGDLAGNVLDTNRTFTTAEKGTIKGTLIDPDGEPITNARITLDSGEETFTDQNGDFEVQAPQGNRIVTIYDKDGNELSSFEVSVEAGKEVTPTSDLTVERHKDKESSLLWLWILIIVIVILVVLGAIVFFVARKPVEDEEEEDDDDYDDDEDIDFDSDEYDDFEFEEDWDDE